MSLSMYAASVPVFQQMLAALAEVLRKGEAHAQAREFDPAVLLQARLAPDMFPLLRQVQIACDFARSVPARLAGIDVPAYAEGEPTFADLHARIGSTLDFLSTLQPEQFDGSEQREILLRPGTPKQRALAGQAYLLAYGLPQFFFHVTTAYALLRHNGVPIGKRDYMGAY